MEQKLKIQYHCAVCTVFCVPLWYVRKKRTFYPFVDYRWELVSHQIPQTLQKCPLLSKHPRLRKPRAEKRKKIEKWYFVTQIVLSYCEKKNVVMVGKIFCNFESEGNLLEQCIRIDTWEQLK